jgi:hypothetical protein
VKKPELCNALKNSGVRLLHWACKRSQQHHERQQQQQQQQDEEGNTSVGS